MTIRYDFGAVTGLTRWLLLGPDGVVIGGYPTYQDAIDAMEKAR